MNRGWFTLVARGAHSATALSALLLLGLDCGEQDSPYGTPSLAESYLVVSDGMCIPFSYCECSTPRWPGEQKCPLAASAETMPWVESAKSRGLVYDGDCLGTLREATDQLIQNEAPDCGRDPVTAVWLDCERECQFFYGTGASGEPCEIVGRRMSTCAQGLACGVDGVCHSPCDLPAIAGQGERCGYEIGEFLTSCADGLACLENVCVVGATAGEPCDGAPCIPTLWCDEGLCREKLAAGSLCTRDDACTDGACESDACAAPQPRACVGFTW